MIKKTSAFIITFIFLGTVIWWVNQNPEALSNINMNNNQNRTVKSLSWETPPALSIDVAQKYFAIINTDKGSMKFELFASETPNTVNNFIFLANQEFYTNTFFHRIIKGFMIQGGDPDGTGMGGPGYTFADEPVNRKYEKGILAMANAGPDTNGSQFFIMHSDYELPPQYVIFGKLVEGEEALDKIAETPVTLNQFGEPSVPTVNVYIDSIEIISE